MSLQLIAKQIRSCIKDAERTLSFFFFPSRYPPESMCFAEIETPKLSGKEAQLTTLKDIFDTSILWAVPTFRRSIERRMKRKYGDPKQFFKLFIPKEDLLVCNHCGHDYHKGHLCKYCYTKVQEETTQMQDAILQDLGINAVEQEVVVLYEGERDKISSEYWEGKRIVEMKKERPDWFCGNLLQKSTVAPSDSKDVKPQDLA